MKYFFLAIFRRFALKLVTFKVHTEKRLVALTRDYFNIGNILKCEIQHIGIMKNAQDILIINRI